MSDHSVPQLLRRGAFEPPEGSDITLDLPGERVRATVVKRVGSSSLVVELMTVPATRAHNYRKGDRIPCRLEASELGGDPVWRAMDDREFLIWRAEQQAEAKTTRQPKKAAS